MKGKGLVASFVAVVVSLVLCMGAGAAGALLSADAPASSTGESTLGLRVDGGMTEAEMEAADRMGNDSNLGLRVTTDAGEDMVVTFWTQGRTHAEVSIGYAEAVEPPQREPQWDWDAYRALSDADPAKVPAGLVEGTDPAPTFDRWCTNPAGTVAYDFSTPVTGALNLYASWNAGVKVPVVLHAAGGEFGADVEGVLGNDADGVTLTVDRYVGMPYRELAAPTRVGYKLGGWFTAPNGAGAGPVKASDTVTVTAGATQVDLYASWTPITYQVRYVNNTGSAAEERELVVPATYDTEMTALAWDADELKAVGFYRPDGLEFDGWDTLVDGSKGDGHRIFAGDTFKNLADTDGAIVALYAQWVDRSEPGPFTVTFLANDGTGDVWRTIDGVEKNTTIDEPADMPKRKGYQFVEWCTDEQCTTPWSFDRRVLTNTTLWAKWALRLDVTVPVSVGFAVNADTGEATGPAADKYTIKSRTVADVAVESFQLRTYDDELEEFFEFANDTFTGDISEEAVQLAWQSALANTRLRLQSEHAAEAIDLPFAGDRVVEEDGSEPWLSQHAIGPEEQGQWTIPEFVYGALPMDEKWAGQERYEKLAVAFGFDVSPGLKVKVGQPGAVPIAHLKVTVSSRE